MSGDVVPFQQQSTMRVVPISAEKPSAEWLTRTITALLSIYYQPDEDEDIFRLQMALWRDALSDLPQQALEMAIRERTRSSSRSRPVPGEIRELAQRFTNYRPAQIITDDNGRPFGPGRELTAAERDKCMAALSELARHLGTPEPKRMEASVGPLAAIIQTVADVHGLTPAHLKGVRKDAKTVQARFLACWAARKHTGASFAAIGRALGDRDHSTAIQAATKAEERITSDPTWADAAAEIDRRLSA